MNLAIDPAQKGALKQLDDLWITPATDSTMLSARHSLMEAIAAIDKVQSRVTDEKERERIRAARIEARRAAELPNLRGDAAERRARVDWVLEQADARTAERKAKAAEHTAERVAKARRQAGQRLLLRALRLIPPDERDKAIAAALRQA